MNITLERIILGWKLYTSPRYWLSRFGYVHVPYEAVALAVEIDALFKKLSKMRGGGEKDLWDTYAEMSTALVDHLRSCRVLGGKEGG